MDQIRVLVVVLRVPRCPLGGPGAEPRSRDGSSIPLVNFLTIVNSVRQFCRKECLIFAGSSIPLVNCRKAGSVLNATFVDAPGCAVELTGAWTAGHNLWTLQAVL